ncbi:hypothetical protein SAMN02745111_00920 [Eubacterium uniforme]|uniref:Uncharacterized protein n=1 Tax=Eubacterium uniforme TaxID=39495 RepID=A0A1T4VGW6_9FIRM|nr:hypothetical protein SAMN02745111_00920 [Eubacterium uniforme]
MKKLYTENKSNSFALRLHDMGSDIKFYNITSFFCNVLNFEVFNI